MDEPSLDDQSKFGKVKFAENAIIFTEGEVGASAYLIRSGRVEIRKGVRGKTPQVIATLGKGELLGEMALFDNRPRMATAFALTNVVLIRMPRNEFLKRLSVLDPVMKSMVLTMVSRTRHMADEYMFVKQEGHWGSWKK